MSDQVAIIYHRFLDGSGSEQVVGGVETYLHNLSHVCLDAGFKPVLFQGSKRPFRQSVRGLYVIGVPEAGQPISNQRRLLYNAMRKELDGKRPIVIFGADHCSVRTGDPRALSIQHGIFWDLPAKYLTTRQWLKRGIGARLKKIRLMRSAIQDFENTPNKVCVDYNFLNWYRTFLGEEPNGQIWVVPNASPLASKEQIDQKWQFRSRPVKVLFARRFQPYRGTEILTEAIKRVLRLGLDIEFTLAGEGPDEAFLRSEFDGCERVHFIRYEHEDVLSIHLEHQIAIIPSVASEGTSFSVAEAMAAGCAVVATNVGGITNMLLNEYNGLMIMPRSENLANAIALLANDYYRCKRIATNAWKTASGAFGLARWQEQWRDILNNVSRL